MESTEPRTQAPSGSDESTDGKVWRDRRDDSNAAEAGGDTEKTRSSADNRQAPHVPNEHASRRGAKVNPPEDISGSIGATSPNEGRDGSTVTSRDPGARGSTAGAGGAGHQPPQEHSSAARAMVPDKEDGENDRAANHAPKNYASRDSGAVMLESSAGSKGMKNLLINDPDKYAISPCEEKQWAVVGLSEDIMVRTIKVISYEKYSSLVEEFQVLASPTYPVNEWLDLGTFTAKFAQGEQTFDVPEPAFARYLKFKFLSHHGNEFYCTVSQVKVHGSTMLESFQHEWQQSNAELREVQDFMMTKKDAKHAAGASNGSSFIDSKVPPAPAGVTGHVQSPTSNENWTGEGGIERRPHAASAASVPPSVSVGGGAAKVGIKDAVRGVPTSTDIPAAGCLGATGADGACLGEVSAENVDSVPAATRESMPLLTEATSMVTGRSDGLETDEVDASNSNGGGVHGVGESRGGDVMKGVTEGVQHRATGGDGEIVGEESGESVPSLDGRAARIEPGADFASRETLGKDDGDIANSAGRSAIAENRSVEGEAEKPLTNLDEGGQHEEQPAPRKGMLHTTMEVISKAVHRSDGTRRKADNAAEDSSGAVPGALSGALKEDGTIGNDNSLHKSAPDSAESGMHSPSGETDLHSGDSLASRNTSGDATVDNFAPSQSRTSPETSSNGSGSLPPRAAIQDNMTGSQQRQDHEKQGHTSSTPPERIMGSGGAAAAAGGGNISEPVEVQPTSSETEDHPELNTHDILQGDGMTIADSRDGIPQEHEGEGSDGVHLGAVEVDDSGENGRETADSRDGASAQNHSSMPSISAEVQVDLIHQPMETESNGAASGNARGSEQLSNPDGVDAAVLAASCLHKLSFGEFQDEVLARMQQAPHQAGAGVAIGGQYESIFKTLTNKIKTLEINQSLFNLYVDEVHSCYQEVIGHMLAEQERARITRSELLNLQNASLTKMGHQWPAFQELQAKVEVMEKNMIVGSVAWYSSLLCLIMVFSNCCVKTCRLFTGSPRRRHDEPSRRLSYLRHSSGSLAQVRDSGAKALTASHYEDSIAPVNDGTLSSAIVVPSTSRSTSTRTERK